MSIRLLLSDDISIEVENWKYSPFIKSLVGSNTYDDIGYQVYLATELLNMFDIDVINRYITFLNTGDIDVDHDMISIMKFMGHNISDIELLYPTMNDNKLMNCNIIHKTTDRLDGGKIVSYSNGVVNLQNNVRVYQKTWIKAPTTYGIVGIRISVETDGQGQYKLGSIVYPITYYRIDGDVMTINMSINVVEDKHDVIVDDKGYMWRRHGDHLVLIHLLADSTKDYVILDYKMLTDTDEEYINVTLSHNGRIQNVNMMRLYSNIYLDPNNDMYRISLDNRNIEYSQLDGLVPNYLQYCYEYCKVYFKDIWIRDNMYPLELFNDPLYECVMLKSGVVDGNINTLRSTFKDIDFVIAGGYALRLLNTNNDEYYQDMDIFCYGDNCDKIIKRLQELYQDNNRLHITANSITIHDFDGTPVQIILRRYSSPTEIIHGFDVDCSSIMLIGDALYCTKRCELALKYKTNMFNTQRASTTYVQRLSKYKNRGYRVMFPNIRLVESMFDRLHPRYIDHVTSKYAMHVISDMLDDHSRNHLTEANRILRRILVDSIRVDHIKNKLRFAGVSDNYENVVKYVLLFNDTKRLFVTKKDIKNTLVIALLDRFTPRITTSYRDSSDYEQVKSDGEYVNYDLYNIVWKEQDPMTQVTSTFNPLEYNNFVEYITKE